MRASLILPTLALSLCAAAHAETTTLQIEQAAIATDASNPSPGVNITLTQDSARTLADFTRARVGKRITLTAGDTVLTTATVQSPIEGTGLTLAPGINGFDGISAAAIVERLNRNRALTLGDAVESPPPRSSVFKR
ncbi:MAG: hypothetical protein REJ50_18880 [Bordetella sp.]|nr:hypothetical protein [Bordetella sp.]